MEQPARNKREINKNLKMNFTILKFLKSKIVSAFKVADEVMRGKAVETIEYEVVELDNIFGILVLGAFIGIPSPPIHITMELLPLMEKEFEITLDDMNHLAVMRDGNSARGVHGTQYIFMIHHLLGDPHHSAAVH